MAATISSGEKGKMLTLCLISISTNVRQIIEESVSATPLRLHCKSVLTPLQDFEIIP